MLTKETLLRLRQLTIGGTLLIDALLVLFPRTFYARFSLGDQFPSRRQFILGMREPYTPDFGHMAGDIAVVSIIGLFIVCALTVIIRKTLDRRIDRCGSTQ